MVINDHYLSTVYTFSTWGSSMKSTILLSKCNLKSLSLTIREQKTKSVPQQKQLYTPQKERSVGASGEGVWPWQRAKCIQRKGLTFSVATTGSEAESAEEALIAAFRMKEEVTEGLRVLITAYQLIRIVCTWKLIDCVRNKVSNIREFVISHVFFPKSTQGVLNQLFPNDSDCH